MREGGPHQPSGERGGVVNRMKDLWREAGGDIDDEVKPSNRRHDPENFAREVARNERNSAIDPAQVAEKVASLHRMAEGRTDEEVEQMLKATNFRYDAEHNPVNHAAYMQWKAERGDLTQWEEELGEEEQEKAA